MQSMHTYTQAHKTQVLLPHLKLDTMWFSAENG